MGRHRLATHAEILAVTAKEAAEELDAVRAHPQVIDTLRELASSGGVGEILNGSVGSDPEGYLRDLADALEPYRSELMDDEPELVERLALVAAALQRAAEPVPA
jgi:hypothetical protein